MGKHIALEKQRELALTGDEMTSWLTMVESPLDLMERILSRNNLHRALEQVCRNDGAAGVDGMTTEDLSDYLKEHWLDIKSALLSGEYTPSAVLRVEIPKPSGGVRKLGIPTVLDRFLQQAVLQVLQLDWDHTFSDSSFGFRPERSAHDAIRQAKRYIESNYKFVVDIDLEKFFDQVCHERLMSKLRKRIDDPRVTDLIFKFLKSGVISNGKFEKSTKGTPQGGPLSPLLSNLVLDELDKELENRGHKFCRYADDCNIYVKSKRAGRRVMQSISRYIEKKLKLKVNTDKSAIDRPHKRKFLGFSFRGKRIKVSDESYKRLKARIRELTQRTRGLRIDSVIEELSIYLRGWKGYYGISECKSKFKLIDSWIKRRLRCYIWKQWGSSGYRRLKELGVRGKLKWNTCKSAHGPWRISHSPALTFALPHKYFSDLGLISLYDNY